MFVLAPPGMHFFIMAKPPSRFILHHCNANKTKPTNMNPLRNTNTLYYIGATSTATATRHTLKSMFATLIILFATLVPTTAQAANDTQIKATSSEVQYIGRVEHNATAGTVRYDWVGTYLRTGFTGTEIAVLISDEGESYHNVFVDGKWI